MLQFKLLKSFWQNHDYYNKISELKQIFFGKQDDYLLESNIIKSTNDYKKLKSTFLEKREFTIASTKKYHYDNGTILLVFNISLDILEFLKGLEVTNEECIKHIAFYINDHCIDEIYKKTFNALRKIYNMDKNEIPFHLMKYGIPKLNNIEINIYCNKNYRDDMLKLYGNIYKLKNKIEKANFLFFQQHFTGREYIDNPSHVRINFNHPTYYLLVDAMLHKDLILSLNGCKDIKLMEIDKVDNIYIYALSKSLELDDISKYGINFNGVDNPRLLNFEKNTYVDIYAISSQPMKIVGNICGLQFSK